MNTHSLPIVIAHRGASGYLPEHSLAGKALAIAMGADYLEQDVVATRDDELIVHSRSPALTKLFPKPVELR